MGNQQGGLISEHTRDAINTIALRYTGNGGPVMYVS